MDAIDLIYGLRGFFSAAKTIAEQIGGNEKQCHVLLDHHFITVSIDSNPVRRQL